jgi:hypothetical protein
VLPDTQEECAASGNVQTAVDACPETAEVEEPAPKPRPTIPPILGDGDQEDPGCDDLNAIPPFSGGPGVWQFKARGEVGAAYAARVTGAPIGCEYLLGGYFFDGFLKPGYGRPAVLIEAKSGTGAPKTDGGEFLFENIKLQKQVTNQVGVALAAGLPIAWVFEKAEHKRAFDLMILGTDATRVIFTRHVP